MQNKWMRFRQSMQRLASRLQAKMPTGSPDKDAGRRENILFWCRKHYAIVLPAAALCLLLVVTSGTHAFFTAADKVVNHFDLSDLSFEIEEPSWENPPFAVKPGDVLPKDPQIVNTGEIPFVVRVKIEERWTPKPGKTDTADGVNPGENTDHVRYFAANKDRTDAEMGVPFAKDELLQILADDQPKTESLRNFALRQALQPNPMNKNGFWDAGKAGSWYHGADAGSNWLYYDRIVDVGAKTEPVFRAVTIREAKDFLNNNNLPDDHAAAYNSRLSKYNLDIYIYAEVVQATRAAWQTSFGTDVPPACQSQWKGV